MAAFLLVSCGDNNDISDIHYDIQVAGNANDHFLNIRLTFTGDKSGETWINAPSTWADQKDLHKTISLLKIENSTKLYKTKSTNNYLVKHANKEIVTIYYSYKPVKSTDNVFMPALLSSNNLHLVGSTFLLIPQVFNGVNTNIKFTWKVPSGWKLVSSLGEGVALDQNNARFEDINKALFVGGKIRIIDTVVADKALKVALSGSWSFSDYEFVNNAKNILYEARNLFKDHSAPNFLISLNQRADVNNISQGVALANSVAMMVSSASSLKSTIAPLLSHELVHTWIGGKLCNHECSCKGTFAWFEEGFTEYFSWIVNLRTQVWSPTDYVNNYINDYSKYNNPEICTAPNQKIEEKFWECPKLQRLPYLRGALLARRWDAVIRESSANNLRLIDMIHALLAKDSEKKRSTTIDLIDETGQQFAQYDFKQSIQKFIINGEKFSPVATDLNDCAYLIDWRRNSNLLPNFPNFSSASTPQNFYSARCLAYIN